jgi:uncharacterized protein (TIGR03437 family)
VRLFLTAILTLVIVCFAFGQTYTIQTFAGGGLPVNIPGTSATLYGPESVAVDGAGNAFFVDGNAVLRLDVATRVLTLVAGNGTAGYSGDNGPAASAQLDGPLGVAVDSAGNVYIADCSNNRVRKVSNGVISTVAGNGTQGYSGDNGLPTSAEIASPSGVAVDSGGNLYIADSGNNRIRKVSNGAITTVAGNGTQGYSGDNGPAASARLNGPSGVAVDSAGNLYIADSSNYLIRKVSNGVITTVAGGGSVLGDNGPATSAQLGGALGVAVDSAGNLYIADQGNDRIRKVSNGVIATVAGDGDWGFSGDNGPAVSAELAIPDGVAVDSAGNLYISDSGCLRIREVSNGVIATVAGGGTAIGDNGPATSAQLWAPSGVAVDSAGNLYIADTDYNRIREVSNGVVTTVAGDGTNGYGGDNGPATSAQLNGISAVAVDSAGNLYIADAWNSRVREVSNGVITTVAGNGTYGYSGDNGPATSAEISSPSGVAVDSAGNLYIADQWNNCVREVSNGMITTVAGNGTPGYSGDNGPATSAQLWNPAGVAVGSVGNLYIADTVNNLIREVTNGVITTVAGNGTNGYSGDNGPAASAQLNGPTGVAVDSAGSLYIVDGQRIRKVSNGVIATVAGNGNWGYSGDNGPASSAQLNDPSGAATDAAGNVYIADSGNNRVRVLTPSGASCSASVTPLVLYPSALGGNFTVNIQTGSQCQWVVVDQSVWITVSAAAGSGSGSVTLNVAADPGGPRTATISVAGVPVTVNQAAAPVLSIRKTHTGNFAQGQAGATYTGTVSNAASAASTSGTVTVTEGPPGGLTLVSMTGAGWTCPAGGTTCTRSDVLAAGSSYPAITVTVNVAPDATPLQVNTMYVSGGGAPVAYAADSTVVTGVAISGPASLPAGQVGVAYAATTVTATGGSGIYTWSATGLPAGLGIGSATGIISGTPTTNSGSPYAVQVTATDSNSARSTRTYSLTINPAPANLPLIGGVSNAASGQTAIAPNTWVTIYGANFTPAGFSDDWSKSIVNGNLPTTLDGVSVSVGGIPAYVNYVSPGQINILTPNVASGSASVTVTTAGAGTTAPVMVTAQQFSPAFFPWPNGQPVATHLDYSWAVKNGSFGATTVPAKPGEYIILWGTGFGPTTPTAPVGVTIPASTTYNAANPISVTIGNTPASVYGTALASGFGGLYQVVALVPATLSNGDYALVATVGGVATASTTLTVHN